MNINLKNSSVNNIPTESYIKERIAMLAQAVDSHIVLFRLGDHYAAIDKDADRLFLLLGWQPTTITIDGAPHSWMEVTPFGVEYLARSPYVVKCLVGEASGGAYAAARLGDATEAATAQVQQGLDRMRLILGGIIGQSMSIPVKALVDNGLDGDHNAAQTVVSVLVTPDGVTAEKADGKSITMYGDRHWHLTPTTMAIMREVRVQASYLL